MLIMLHMWKYVISLGPFAIEEGLVETSNEITKVNVKSINTNALITLDVPTPDEN